MVSVSQRVIQRFEGERRRRDKESTKTKECTKLRANEGKERVAARADEAKERTDARRVETPLLVLSTSQRIVVLALD
jgi:hypothetical protein